jgi:GT2 family glycosyltransferase/SAM-dependent methyltransferase
MEFSGERVIPARVEPTLWAEHLARYGLASHLASGLRVLDFGCGTGYGTALLKDSGAAFVVGVDSASDAVAFARSEFQGDDLHFVGTDCLLPGLADGSFDLVVSFETIEHVASYEAFLSEVFRLLRPDGRFVLSTPNKKTYSDERPGEANPFHVHEFYGDELRRILEQHFPTVELYGQWISEGVVFAHLSGATGFEPESTRRLRILEPRANDPMERCDYLVAVCAPRELAAEEAPDLEHYFFMSGTNEVGDKRRRILELQTEVEERTRWAQERDRTVTERDAEIYRLGDELEEEGGRLAEAVREADELTREIERVRALHAEAVRGADELAAELERERALHAEIGREAESLASEVKRLRHSASRVKDAVARQAVASMEPLSPGAPTPRPEVSPDGQLLFVLPSDEILFIQSGSPNVASECLKILRTKVAPEATYLYVTHDVELVPCDDALPPGSRILVTESPFADLLSLAGFFRWGKFRAVVVMFTGEPGYRRFKLLGLSLISRRLLIFNENGDCFFYTPWKLLRHLAWRLREWITPDSAWRKVSAAFRIWWAEGTAEAVRRIRRELRDGRRRRIRYQPKRIQRMRSLAFPRYEEPDLSVVIPVHDQERVTWSCLRSIVASSGDVPYEVVVVDDASGEPTRRMLGRHANLRVVRLDPNQGFVAACNAGAEVARGRYVLFLNSDTEILPGCFEAFLEAFEQHPARGAVGAKLIYPDGTLQEAGGLVWRDGEAWNFGRDGDPLDPSCNYLREVDYCSGAALAVRRELFERLGGFDPVFAPGYWEDTDLCFRLRAEGYEVVYQPEAVVVHLEGMTAGRSTESGMKAYQIVNQKTFKDRWREELERHVEHDPNLVFLARDRRRQKIVLVIDHYVPTPDKDAGSYVMYMVLMSLRRLGCRVVFWPDNLHRTAGYADDLQRHGIEVVYGPVDFKKFVREKGAFFDCVVMHRAKIAHKYLAMIGDRIEQRVYICADLEHVREKRRAVVTGEATEAIVSLEAREAAIARRVDRIAVHSPVERDILAEEFPWVDVSVLPLPVKFEPLSGEPFESRSDLLFVGSTHPPNVDAVVYFGEEIGPLLQSRLPGVRLTVAGEVSKRLPRGFRTPELDCVGFVPDLGVLYGERRVFVAPLRYGAGIKGKILEAMSFGLPVVTTRVGAEGIAIENGVNGFVADDPEELVAAVARLYEDEELWLRVRREGRALIAREYSEAAFRDKVRELVKREAPGFGSGVHGAGESRAVPGVALARRRS